MLILCYFIIKTLVYEILNNPESIESLFQAVPKAEKQYFPLFGFTFIVLSIEFLFDKFSQYLHQQNPGKNEDQIKQMLYQSFTAQLNNGSSTKKIFNDYFTFRYNREREDKWLELKKFFENFMQNVIKKVFEESYAI